jgi:hypothetical protein
VGAADDTQTPGDRDWSSLERQKGKHGLLLMIHILWYWITPETFEEGRLYNLFVPLKNFTGKLNFQEAPAPSEVFYLRDNCLLILFSPLVSYVCPSL